MVIKTLLFFVFLFVAYTALLMVAKKDFSAPQYQYQENIIKADKYIYQAKVPKNVIIGTSLSAEIVADSLPGFYNMAMAGMSMLEGYDIIIKRKTLPKTVFIESNLYYHTEREDFKETFNSKIVSFFRGKLISLRDENQPVGVLNYYLKSKDNTQAAAKKKIDYSDPDPPYFKAIIAYARAKSNEKPDTAKLIASLNNLARIVKYLEANGARVYFFGL